MTHTINLTDGSTTIDLYDTVIDGIFATGWELASPGSGKDAEPEIAHSLDLLIQATTSSALQTLVRSVEQLLWAAAYRRRTQLGVRVYLQVQWDGEASLWRTEVLGGKLEVTNAPDQWGNKKLEATLAMTCVAYWEGPETQIALTNSSASNNTSGLTIYNHDDSGTNHDNYVQIAAAAVAGVLPTPVKIELKHTTGSSVNFTNIYMANNVYADPANLTHIIEGESRDSGGGTVTADANSSGGNYNALTTIIGVNYMDFSIAAAQVAKLGGRWFRLLSRFRFIPANTTIQPQLVDTASGVALWSGPIYLHTTSNYPVIDLGAIPIPPGGYSASWGGIKLELRITAASIAAVELDFIQLTPTDSFRHLRLYGYPIANNDLVIDDGTAGLTYVSRSSAFAPLAVPRGEPLMVYPGRDQRIYVLADESANAFNIARTWAVRLWYRQRRLTI